MILKAYFAVRKFFNKRGVGTVEILIILAVLIALALIFRQFIIEVAERIFEKIRENADKAIEGL
ncbi:MAG: multidrug transporter [Clostridiaceae bacterium]|jgi:competence protein ComGC|nr:multidrug transporter [Clostridiaceae bacterium]